MAHVAIRGVRAPTFWYVYPRDAGTNKVFSDNLDEEDSCEEKLCSDGKRRNLWRCSTSNIAEFENSATDLRLRFRIFVQEGMYGKIRPWLFGQFSFTEAKRR